ncbi:MAG: hypothetical protein ABXS91_08595 [Sulfurimonas sp.]
MSKLHKLSFGLLGTKAPEETVDEEVSENTIQGLMQDLIQSSMPRNLMYTATTQKSFNSVSRDAEYLERHEIYQDSFTREMVKVIIARAIGVTHDGVLPFQVTVSKEAGLNDKIEEVVKKDLNSLTKMINKNLLEVVMDSQFYGDGYAAIETGDDGGINNLIYNFSTKAFNITPYVTNKGTDVAFEVSANTKLIGGKQRKSGNGRVYVSPHRVARMNAQSNGIMELQADNIIAIENMNAFSDNETVYEDFIYGGVIEGCVDSFKNFKWAVNSLANMRISSSMIERFITHTLDSTSEAERKILKQALEAKIKAVRDAVKERSETKDPTAMIANHIIPTTSDNTNSVSIQESTPQFNQQVDDIMFHIKVYLGDIGFNIDMTPFSQSQIGGGEKDGVVQNSLQMDTQGEQIRGAIAAYIEHIVSVHFLSKYQMEIDLDYLDISFSSTINKAKIDAETQRMEAISNVQQIGSIIDQYKQSGFQDTPDNRVMLKNLLKDVVSNTSGDKETIIESMVNHILSKPKEPTGEEL